MFKNSDKKRRLVKRLNTSINYNQYKKQSIGDAVSNRVRKQARRDMIIRIEAFFVFVLFLAVLAQGLRLNANPVISIDQADFSDATVSRIENSIRQKTSDVFQESLFYYTKPFAPRQELLDALYTLPEVSMVSLEFSRTGPRPIIDVRLQEIVFIYRYNGNDYLLTNDARPLEGLSSLQPTIARNLPLIIDRLSSDQLIERGSPVLSQNNLERLLKVHTMLKVEQGSNTFFEVKNYELSTNPGELIVYLANGKQLVLFLDETVEEQGGGLIHFVRQSSASGIDMASVSRIDARVPGRVTYQ